MGVCEWWVWVGVGVCGGVGGCGVVGVGRCGCVLMVILHV